MAILTARPSPYTQVTTPAEWEAIVSYLGASCVDGSGSLVPTIDSPGRNALMSAGSAFVRGQLWRCDASVTTAVPTQSAGNRVDRLVLRLDRSGAAADTYCYPAIVQGTSGSANVPALTQNATGIWELPISHWTTNSNGTLSGLIDDRRITNDTWHDMRPLQNSFIGTISSPVHAPPQYRFSDDCKFVEVAGYFQTPAAAGNYNNLTIATLPAAYRPLDPAGVDWFASSVADSSATPVMRIHNDGTLTFHYSSATLAQTIIGMFGRYPLQDQNGFLLT